MPFRLGLMAACALLLSGLLGNLAHASGFSSAASLQYARENATATLLPSGKVLVASGDNGLDVFSGPIPFAELYDPANNTWTSAASMTTARRDATATLLPSGKVLVAGGYDINQIALASAELYDPATNAWSSAGTMSFGRAYASATLLPSGNVLVAGGRGDTSTELYEAASNTWISAAPMASARSSHTATLLPSGKVLVAGGNSNGTPLQSAELYDPSSDIWTSAGTMSAAHYAATATLLPSGKVLVAGGFDGSKAATNSAELYDPASNAWTSAGMLATARTSDTATLLPSGEVLVTGGYNGSVALASAELYDPASDAWTSAGTIAGARYDHTATLLPSGKVLIAAGYYQTNTQHYVLASAQLYDPATGTWSAAASMSTGRAQQFASLLPSGKVLVGGDTVDMSAELYDPVANTWSSAGTMLAARLQTTATLLPSGKVLVAAGGDATNCSLLGCVPLDSAEMYDPAGNSWSSAGTMSAARRVATATLLPSGKVLVAGGEGASLTVLASAELYDPAGNGWSSAGTMATARFGHTATLLPSGQVLVAGGYNGTYLDSAELYDPAGNSWSSITVPMSTPRLYATATLLPSGKVLVAGGDDGSTTLDSAELYDPAGNTWTSAGTLTTKREYHTATLLPSGKVLVAGGYNGSMIVDSTDLYDPASNTWTSGGTLSAARDLMTATLLASGKVLVAGGNGPLSSADLYDPGLAPASALQPVLDRVNKSLANVLSGASPGSNVDSNGAATATGFMPRREASGGGSTSNSATNYPVFQVERIDNEQMRFIPKDESVDTTDTDFTAAADALSGFSSGPMLVRAWVNGVPSAAQLIGLPEPHTVTPSVDDLNGSGTISPDTVQTVDYEATTSFMVTPSTGSHIYAVISTCGGGGLAGSTYTTGPITFDCAVTANFQYNTYTVTPSVGSGSGTISPDYAEMLYYNHTETYFLSPSTGYHIASVGGTCGGSLAGSDYTINPITADCTVIANFAIDTHTIGGTVSGLSGGTVVLQDNGGDDLSISADGSFTFMTPIASGSDYAVTVLTQPSSPTQTCSVTSGSGTVTNADITSVSVTCTTNTYTIGGTVSGLSGGTVVLQDNGGDDLSISADGSFTFMTPIASGSDYAVAVLTQPSSPTQTCSVTSGSGTVTNADITNVSVSCAAPANLSLIDDDGVSYAYYGEVLDYTVTLTNNGGTAVNGVAISGSLSGALDAASVQWTCTGTTNGASCGASGGGSFSDTVNLPASGSVTYDVAVDVLPGATQSTATFSVSATGVSTVDDIDTLVVFRDGFEGSAAAAAHVQSNTAGSEVAPAVLQGDHGDFVKVPPATRNGIDTLRTLRAGESALLLQRLSTNGRSYVRLLTHNTADGYERASAWSSAAAGTILGIGSVAGTNGQRIVLLNGTAQPLSLALPAR